MIQKWINCFVRTVGLLYKYLNRQLVISTTYALLTIACAVIPLLPNLWTLYVCAFIFGLGSSIQVCGYTVWTIEMWQKKAGPLLQVNDFGFGLGSILCTVILKPYLVGELGDPSIDDKQTLSFRNETQIIDIDRRERLALPCLLIGVCVLPSR